MKLTKGEKNYLALDKTIVIMFDKDDPTTRRDENQCSQIVKSLKIDDDTRKRVDHSQQEIQNMTSSFEDDDSRTTIP